MPIRRHGLFCRPRQECAILWPMFGIRASRERYYADDPQGSEGFHRHNRTS